MSQTKAQLVSVEGGVGNGTAALPALTGDDTDTGLSFGTNEVSVSTSGSERFRFGSAGQLGIGGATYGTDGQVLTSTGATTAPAWESLSPGFTWLTGQDLSGNASVTFTGIPTTANIIKVGFAEVSQNGNGSGGQINVRVGNGSIVAGTSYRYSVSYGGTSQDSDGGPEWRLLHNNYTAGNTLFNGTLELVRHANANWWCSSWTLSDHGGYNVVTVGGGFYNGSSGLIDRIQFLNGFSTFDDGNVVVGYA